MVDAWRDFFSAEEQVSIVEGDVTSLAVDAIVSPANSFGFMDGSLDHAISERLGWHSYLWGKLFPF
jgi:O-acetyl-ADP-ribose deacetylase (regulator of RNase III)